MRTVLSFRFALLGSLGLLHACGARTAEGPGTNKTVNEGTGNRNDADASASGTETGPGQTGKPDLSKPGGTVSVPGTATPDPSVTSTHSPVPTGTGTSTAAPTGTVVTMPDPTAMPIPDPTTTPPPPRVDGGTSTLLETVCPQPQAESSLALGLLECANGLVHRPSAATCAPPPDDEPILVDAGVAPSIDGGLAPQNDYSACTRNADCSDAPHGRCQVNGNASGGYWTYCDYACTSDADCDGNSVCECQNGIGNCASASCRTDADCGPGHACTRFVIDGCGPTTRYACTSDADTCRVDSECGVTDFGVAGCWPSFDANAPGTRCSSTTCQEGRPFLVAGSARTASVVERADWLSSNNVATAGLTPSQRQTLSDHWTRVAQMEHASIAAFARFALQLLAVGAPADLLSATTAAMVDETLHARLAFGLASAYGGRTLGPAPLDCSDALDGCDLQSVVVGTLLEGCIGETVAALDAQRALEQCQDPAVRSVLEVIVRDETRHAELAWKFVQWAFDVDSALIGKALDVATAQLQQAALPRDDDNTTIALMSADTAWQRRYGVTSDAEQHQLRVLALEQVVLPCLNALAKTNDASVDYFATARAA